MRYSTLAWVVLMSCRLPDRRDALSTGRTALRGCGCGSTLIGSGAGAGAGPGAGSGAGTGAGAGAGGTAAAGGVTTGGTSGSVVGLSRLAAVCTGSSDG